MNFRIALLCLDFNKRRVRRYQRTVLMGKVMFRVVDAEWPESQTNWLGIDGWRKYLEAFRLTGQEPI